MNVTKKLKPHPKPSPAPAAAPRGGARGGRKSDVIQLRATAEDKALLARAAEIDGRSLSDFVLQSARREALDRLLDRSDLVFSQQDFDKLLDMLDQPPPLDVGAVERMNRKPPWRR